MHEHLFFNWEKAEHRLIHLSHLKFRIISTVFLIMACALFLMRVSFLTDSLIIVVPAIAMIFLLAMAAIHLIFEKQLLFSKLVLLSSMLLFQAVEFAQSGALNLYPLTPNLVAIIFANGLLLAFLTMLRE